MRSLPSVDHVTYGVIVTNRRPAEVQVINWCPWEFCRYDGKSLNMNTALMGEDFPFPVEFAGVYLIAIKRSDDGVDFYDTAKSE